MLSSQTATVKPVDDQTATGLITTIFTDIKRTKNIDVVPAFWRTIATSSVQLELVWTTLKTLMHPESSGRDSRIEPKTREMIALAVSVTNGCSYCIQSHTAALQKLGMDQETLGELMAIVGLFNMTNALANGYQVEPDVRPLLD